MWTGDPADDVANSSTSTSGHSTPWSASLQRSQARRRLDDLDKDIDDDDDDTTPTPHPHPNRGGPEFDWADATEYRRPVRRRRPAAARDQDRGRSPHPRERWEDRRSMESYDPHVLAVMAAAQPWLAAAAAAQCCCSGHGGGGHGGDRRSPCGAHVCQLACRTFPGGAPPRRQSCCSCSCTGSGGWSPPHCGRCCGDRAAQSSPCQSWAGPRCKVCPPYQGKDRHSYLRHRHLCVTENGGKSIQLHSS